MSKYTKEEIREFIKESNAIEGVYSEEAIKDSIQAWEWLDEEVGDLSLMDILIVHKIVLKNLNPMISGKLRAELKSDVQVGGRACPRYYDVPNRIANWLANVNNVDWDEESIVGIHIAFERIHPFADGNGRVGRLIYCWMRQVSGYPIHIIREKDKEKYYEWFRS